ncbi:TIGR03745 family integrating conjugative element membrane protein [Salinisphaera orenii]|uniref:TIGR03745 family integrating conjugative element membrane protein n=1 Tax=Salinisphaera orenii TaxID=856731 RepID=UPI000DBE3071
MSVLQSLGRTRRRVGTAILAATVLPQTALAAQGGGQGLPTVQQPQNGGGSGSLLGTLHGYAADAVVLVGLLLAVSAFIVVGYSSIGSFTAARQRNEWGTFGMTLVVGVGLCIAIIWLANKASNIL